MRAGARLRRSRQRLHEARTVARAARRARRRPDEPERFGRDDLERLRSALPAGAVADVRLVELPARGSPWTATGIALRAGDEVTTFAAGRVYLSRALDVRFAAGNQLWFRAGGAPIFRGTRASHTFTAERDGDLELASHPPGRWVSPDGAHAGTGLPDRLASGGLAVLVVRWARGADSAAVLRDAAQPPAMAELERRETAVPEPEGWEYLWDVGAAEIYRAEDASMLCDTHGDVGLLKREVDLPLTHATRLRWSWRVDELPSALPEDTLPTHDYLSLALEFDNGHDLSWHWSAGLPVDHGYRCPLPGWTDRETHVVVRTGTRDVGRWVDEERAVRSDYERAVGEPPERIVGVWFIAVSLFQRGRGRCAYRDIEIADGERVERPLR